MNHTHIDLFLIVEDIESYEAVTNMSVVFSEAKDK